MQTSLYSQKVKARSWIIWSCAVLFYFYEFMIQVSPGVMADDLMRTFHISAAQLGGLSAYYFYSYASMQLVVGVLLDSWGPKRLLATSSLICALGCYLFAQTNSLASAELSRLLIGAGSACAVISSFKLATLWFPARYFGIMTGLTVMVGMLGAVFGEGPLSWIVAHIGWRSAMFMFSTIGCLLMVLILVFIQDSRAPQYTRVQKSQIFDTKRLLTVLKSRQTWLTSIYGGLMFAPTTALGALWGVPWMCSYYNLDRTASAQIVSYLFFGWAIGSPLSGFLTNLFVQCKITMRWGSFFSFISISLLIFFKTWSIAILSLLWFSFGFFSSGFLPFMTLIRLQHNDNHAGTAMGFGNGMNMIGGALLQPLIGWVLDIFWQGDIVTGIRHYSPDTYTRALVVVPILIVLAFGVLFFIHEQPKKQQ